MLTGLLRTGLLGLVIVLLSTQVAVADVSVGFTKGQKHLTIYGGTGYAFDDEYFVIGLSGSYFITNGLNLGLAYENWTSGSPGISKLTPSIQYVFYQVQTLKPYLGAFYTRTYIDNLPDLESTGARAGIYIASGKNVYFMVGGVYETFLNCEETTYKSCDNAYPEVGVTFAF